MLGLVRDDKKRFKEDISEAKKLLSEGRGKELLSKWIWDEYPISAKSYINIFGDNSEAAIFNFYNPQDSFKTLSEVTLPIYSVMGKKDDTLVIPIEDTLNMIQQKAASSTKCEYQILGNATHDYRGFEDKLSEAMLDWIKKLT